MKKEIHVFLHNSILGQNKNLFPFSENVILLCIYANFMFFH